MMAPRRLFAYGVVLLAAATPSSQGQSAIPYKPAKNADEAVKRIEELGGVVRKAALEGDALEADFRHSSVTDDHLQHLLVLKNVAVVRLRECTIGDTGLVHLSKLSGLKKLHLEKTAVSDVGLKHLSSLKNLETLNLYGCGVGDAGLSHLATMSRLKSLIVTETKATEKGIASLRNSLPTLFVVPDRELERKRMEAAWATAKRALADMEVRFQESKKEAEVLTPQVAELKKKLDEATKKLNEAKGKSNGAGIVEEAQAALKAAQQQHSQAANAAKNFELAKKHLDAYRQLEADARSRVEALRAK